LNGLVAVIGGSVMEQAADNIARAAVSVRAMLRAKGKVLVIMGVGW
jgi:hypothetical protein